MLIGYSIVVAFRQHEYRMQLQEKFAARIMNVLIYARNMKDVYPRVVHLPITNSRRGGKNMRARVWKLAVLVLIIVGVGLWINFGEIGGAPQRYPSDVARENGDVVNSHNIDKLDRFIENSKAIDSDRVRITTYTIEGDAILFDLIREDGKLSLIIDNTRDRYSTSRGIDKLELKDVIKITEDGMVHYIAQFSIGEEMTLLTLSDQK